MKKIIIKSAIALQFFLLLSAGIAAQAQTTEKPQSELKIAGRISNEPVFELHLNNTSFGNYTIVITDESGIVLYEEAVRGTNISRKFLLNKTELGSTGVVFEVYKGAIKEAVYAVKNNIITADGLPVTAKK